MADERKNVLVCCVLLLDKNALVANEFHIQTIGTILT